MPKRQAANPRKALGVSDEVSKGIEDTSQLFTQGGVFIFTGILLSGGIVTRDIRLVAGVTGNASPEQAGAIPECAYTGQRDIEETTRELKGFAMAVSAF